MLNGTLPSISTGTAGTPSSQVLSVQGISGMTPIAVQLPGDSVVEYGVATLIPSATETTIVSYVVPVGKTFHGIGFVATGNSHGLFRMYFNGVAKIAGRSSVAVPTMDISFKQATTTALAGQTVTIKVTHYAPSTADFEGTILGYLI